MSVTRIASRYAKSLIDLSVEQNKLERTLTDMQSLKGASTNRDFYLMIKSPIINASKKKQIFNRIFAEHFDPLSIAFLEIILRKGRESYLPDIANEFISQYQKIKKVSTITLTTAAPLAEGSLESISKQLVGSNATDENVEIQTQIDPAIIGGFIIEFDDKLYDSSVRYKLDRLKKEFSENLYVKNF